MNTVINEFPDLPAVVTRIDLLVYQANRATAKKERRAYLKEAQRLANAYEDHCGTGKLFKQFCQDGTN